MDMTLRWYGEGNDSVTLDQIRQIPGVTGVITALHDIPAGEAWTYEDVMKRKQEVEAKGLKLVGVESINVHEDIKIGLPTRVGQQAGQQQVKNGALGVHHTAGQAADRHTVQIADQEHGTGQHRRTVGNNFSPGVPDGQRGAVVRVHAHTSL